ncbi:MAG: hypothetical protein LBL34_05640 [Clostridiales bacterium]|jgi:predicted  nucleic acid-binding Zn-ribbon protein|nr:hypothetical protein [Clostridiales bacterium]
MPGEENNKKLEEFYARMAARRAEQEAEKKEADKGAVFVAPGASEKSRAVKSGTGKKVAAGIGIGVAVAGSGAAGYFIGNNKTKDMEKAYAELLSEHDETLAQYKLFTGMFFNAGDGKPFNVVEGEFRPTDYKRFDFTGEGVVSAKDAVKLSMWYTQRVPDEQLLNELGLKGASTHFDYDELKALTFGLYNPETKEYTNPSEAIKEMFRDIDTSQNPELAKYAQAVLNDVNNLDNLAPGQVVQQTTGSKGGSKVNTVTVTKTVVEKDEEALNRLRSEFAIEKEALEARLKAENAAKSIAAEKEVIAGINRLVGLTGWPQPVKLVADGNFEDVHAALLGINEYIVANGWNKNASDTDRIAGQTLIDMFIKGSGGLTNEQRDFLTNNPITRQAYHWAYDRYTKVQEDLRISEKACEDLRRELANSGSIIIGGSSYYRELANEVAALLDTTVSGIIPELKEVIAKAAAAQILEQKLKEAQEELSKKEAELAKAIEERDALQGQIEKLEEQARNDAGLLESERAAHEDYVLNHLHDNDEYNKLVEDLEAANVRIGELEQELADYMKDHIYSNEEYEALEEARKQLEEENVELKDRVDGNEKTIQEKDDEIGKLKDRIDELEKGSGNEEELKRLRDEIDGLKKDIVKLEQEKADLVRENEGLKKTIEEKNKTIADKDAEIARLNKIIDEFDNGQIKTIKETLDKLQVAYDELLIKCDEYRVERDELAHALGLSEADVASLTAENSQLRQDKSVLEQGKAELEDRLQSAKDDERNAKELGGNNSTNSTEKTFVDGSGEVIHSTTGSGAVAQGTEAEGIAEDLAPAAPEVVVEEDAQAPAAVVAADDSQRASVKDILDAPKVDQAPQAPAESAPAQAAPSEGAPAPQAPAESAPTQNQTPPTI